MIDKVFHSLCTLKNVHMQQKFGELTLIHIGWVQLEQMGPPSLFHVFVFCKGSSYVLPWERRHEWKQIQAQRYPYFLSLVYVKIASVLLCISHVPMVYSPPGSSVHRILQVRIVEWVAILFSWGSSQPRDRTQVSCIAGEFFTIWATGESQYPINHRKLHI